MMFAFSVLFTLYYSDRRDRETFAMVVTVLALALCLSTVALFPVDIFLVSTILDPATGLRRDWATNLAIANMQWVVRTVYYGTQLRHFGPSQVPN
jgi:LMBR1 domain-containing protein 1